MEHITYQEMIVKKHPGVTFLGIFEGLLYVVLPITWIHGGHDNYLDVLGPPLYLLQELAY